jgi:protein ImuB
VPDLANPQPLIPNPYAHPLYACLYLPPGGEQPASAHDIYRREREDRRENLDHSACSAPAKPKLAHASEGWRSAVNPLIAIAQQFSPRYEQHRDDLVSIDVSGLERLLGPARVIGEELRREATARGVRPHVAIAATRMAAMLLALTRPGVTIVEPGTEAEALAPVAIGILEKIPDDKPQRTSLRSQRDLDQKASAFSALSAVKRWGLKTLGELAALPPADLVARLGRQAMTWQAIARGEDICPLVPTLESERFESSLELEWPIEGLEPLSFVLTRLLEPLSTRLERRDRGAAVLHVLLRLVTRDPSGTGWEEHARRLQLPTPMRDVRTLRTLALLDLESHPPTAAIDRVRIVIDPTPGRVLQHTLFARAQPTPEQLSTLVARLGALMGQDRFGAPAVVDTYRPGAFAMTAFKTEHDGSNRGDRKDRREENVFISASSADSAVKRDLVSALRRCRHPVPARVVVADGQPVRVTTDRRGFAGGVVMRCAGPWRSSGNWWAGDAGSGGSGRSDRPGGENTPSTYTTHQTYPAHSASWNRDEWDVALNDGAVYRIFQDRVTDAWFIDAIVD